MTPTAVTPERTRFRPALLAGLLMMFASLAAVPSARAQFFDGMGGLGASQNLEGFTVSGKGQVSAKPDLVEIDLDISAASELTADAIVKYRDAKRRLHEAFSALKLANVGVDERGLLVEQKGAAQSPYFFDSMPNNRSKTEVQLSRKLVAKATNLRKMDEEAVLQLVAKLIDVAQDAGARVGPKNENNYYYYRYRGNNANGLVRFVVDDIDKVQEQAYEKAIANARSRADRLARLSGVELGPVVAIREVVIPGENAYNPYGNGEAENDDDHPKKRLETAKYQEIPVRVELLVRFSVRAKGEIKAAAGGPPK